MTNDFKTYTKFSRHANNVGEIIDAGHMNKVQLSVNTVETNISVLADKDFVNKTLFTFDNNIYANSIFIDELKNLNYVNMEQSQNIFFDSGDNSISLKDGMNEGYIISSIISSEYGSIINDFIVVSDVYTPIGGTVKYFVMAKNGESHPVNANTPNVPFNVKAPFTELSVKILLKRNIQGDSPKVYSWALMYFDYILEGTYGMTNPDLKRFTSDQAGNTILVRDRANKDRLVRVIENGSVTELYYDDEGKLDNIITTSEKSKIQDNLLYEPYLGWDGKISTVLTGIRTEPLSLEDAISDNLIFEDGQVTT